MTCCSRKSVIPKRILVVLIMSNTEVYVVSAPQKQFAVTFNSLGKYLFECLKKRKSEEIFGIDASYNQTFTCGSLLEKSIKLSIALQEMSIKKDDVVALICENTLKSTMCLLALTFLGIQTNLVNFAYTVRELKHVFGISKPKCVICVQSSLDNVLMVKKEFSFIETVILIDESEEAPKDIKNVDALCNTVTDSIDSFKPLDTDVTDTAILLLSSGTTGLPKCVELSHINFVHMVNYIWNKECMDLSTTDITVSVLPLFHIYGLLIHFSAIVTSLKLVVMKSFKSDLFLESIQKYKATKLYTVPPIIQFLLTNEKVKNYDISSLKDILVSGAPVGNVLYKQIEQKLKNTKVRVQYGVTELSGFCTAQPAPEDIRSSGVLLNNQKLKTVDIETNSSLPAYRIGELRVKGPGCLKAYKNNPAETEKAFDKDGYFCTGDLGYYDEKENIFISGRLKELIKFKAFQVSPVELENVIMEHPAVCDCAVFGRPDEKSGELPTAFVILQNHVTTTEEEIVNFVAERISPQKRLHGGVIFVQEIPRNPTGKILRRELKEYYNSIKK